MKYLSKHLIAVVSVLESLSETADDATTRCDAQGLLRQLKTWENMFLLKVFDAIFHSADILSKVLQSRVIDCARADRKVAEFRNHLSSLREDEQFHDIMNSLDKLDEEISFTPPP